MERRDERHPMPPGQAGQPPWPMGWQIPPPWIGGAMPPMGARPRNNSRGSDDDRRTPEVFTKDFYGEWCLGGVSAETVRVL